jgi:hypothetical protein
MAGVLGGVLLTELSMDAWADDCVVAICVDGLMSLVIKMPSLWSYESHMASVAA